MKHRTLIIIVIADVIITAVVITWIVLAFGQKESVERTNTDTPLISQSEPVEIDLDNRPDTKPEPSWEKPSWLKPGVSWQIQLSGQIDTSVKADVFDIDYETPKAVVDKLRGKGAKVVCYVSVGSAENYRDDYDDFPDKVLGNKLDGWPNERWLDIREISTLKPIMKRRFQQCVEKGFDAIDPDNVDGFANKNGFGLTAEDQLAYNRMIAGLAHELDMPVGLKNDLDQVKQLEPSFDFAVNEQCFQYGECSLLKPFTDNDKPVFHIEYSGKLAKICPVSATYDFSTLLKKLSLDASIRGDCNSIGVSTD